MRLARVLACAAVVLGVVDLSDTGERTIIGQERTSGSLPAFQYDPSWPKPLPNYWLTGNIGAMAIDANDHIWIAQRPGSTTSLSERYRLTGEGECCQPAPPVMEFDTAGNLVQSWGPVHDADGQLLGQPQRQPTNNAPWPTSEHGIYVDTDGAVWVGNNGQPSQILKFTRDGKFLLKIGGVEAQSSNDTANLAGPTGLVVDPVAGELFVGDGYRNRRVVVFDAKSGAYKRHWGAYGKRPPDGPLGSNPIEGQYDPNVRSAQFATVHCLAFSKDRLLYVCDRVNNRIQVFRPDGTFVKEGVVAPATRGFGAVHAIAFSPDQRFMYVGDGANKKVWILDRESLNVLGSFGTGGRAGGQFLIVHALVVDSRGNLYVGETVDNNRVQRFNFVGMR